MAIRGQRFSLDPDSDNFTFNLEDNHATANENDGTNFVGEIKERDPTGIPPPPKQKQTKTGFPQHRPRGNVSAFRIRQQQQAARDINTKTEPSDRAIMSHVSRKYGIDPEAKEKQEISDENKKRLAQMSVSDIEEARAEIMANMNPAFLERFLKRANIDEDQNDQNWDGPEKTASTSNATNSTTPFSGKKAAFESGLPHEELVPDDEQQVNSNNIEQQFQEILPSIHFPVPPRNPDDFVPLDPNAPTFLSDLKKHYFPELPDNPSTLAWLQDPTEEESDSSPYAPTQSRYAPSDIRFDFTGRLLAPNDSRDIPVSKGLHHHGEAPESAGYTIPELSILSRSVLPNQRCMAYQVLGRVFYRLGRGDFGQRGSELVEGLWGCVETERPIEVMMSEANRTGGHVSAKAYATEALWLWRKGGGGDRGILKPGERIAK